MLHRHLNHQRFTPAAIDDVITRGKWEDWAALRRAVLSDPALMERVERICLARAKDPYDAQRYRFWANYAKAHRALD